MADNSGVPATTSAASLICFDAYEVDLETAELRKAGTRITLHEQSFRVLLVLLQAQGGLVAKSELRKALWPSGTDVDFDRSINKAIGKLRVSLDDSVENPRFIETVRDQGYRFLVPVVFTDAKDVPAREWGEGTHEVIPDEALNPFAGAGGLAAFGAYEFDPSTPELRKRGVLVRVHLQSLKLLLLLLRNQGQLLSKEELQKLLWPSGTHVDFDSSLKKAVSNLRIALGDSAEKPSFVETLPGRGYRFIAPVHYLGKGNGAGGKLSRDSAAYEQTAGQKPFAESSLADRPKPRAVYAVVAAVVVVLGCAVALYIHWYATTRKNTVRPSIAVLEFKNISGQPEEEWLATAFSEWVASELAAGGQLRLIPGDQVMQMEMEMPAANAAAPTPDALSQIRKILGTDLVVSGDYKILGTDPDPEIEVELQLHDTKTGKVLKTLSETARKSNLFALISRTGKDLRFGLGIHAVTRDEARQVAADLPANTDAIRLYFEGLHKLRVGDSLAASDLLQKAVLADPNDAHIHDALASTWENLGYEFKAKEEAHKALNLATNLPREEHLLIEGRFEETATHWDRAVEIYRTLFEFFPDNLEYGLLLVHAETEAGKPKDAEAGIVSLKHLPVPSRDDPRIDLAEAAAAIHVNGAEQALPAIQRAIKKATDAGASLIVARAESAEASALMNQGKYDKAIEPLNDAREKFSNAGIDGGVARALRARGLLYEYALDYKPSERDMEEALAISRRIGFQREVVQDLLALGELRLCVGDPVVARVRFAESLSIAQEINDDDDVAMSKSYLGQVLLQLAGPREARKMYQESLEIFEQRGRQQWVALLSVYLGEASHYEGKFDRAFTELNRSLELYQKLGYKEGIGWAEIMRAGLFLDQGHIEEAITTARSADTDFTAVADDRGHELALVQLAQALIEQGKIAEARKNIEAARESWNGGKDPEAGLNITLSEAMLGGASNSQAERIEGEKKARALVNEAIRLGFVNDAYEIRLELAKIESSIGKKEAAIEHLKALIKDADDRGMGLISWKAENLLRGKFLTTH